MQGSESDMKRWRTLLVDDEPLARRRLRELLCAYAHVEIVGEASDTQQASEAMAEHHPDLLFLDIQMPRETGLEFVTRLRIDAVVVFVTAFDEYALRAFEVNALDYLLKPVSPTRLAESMRRLGSTRPAHTAEPSDLVKVCDGARLRIVSLADIVWIAADRDYSNVHLKSGEIVFSDNSLAEWKRRLQKSSFIQLRRNALAAISQLHSIERTSGGVFDAVLQNKHRLRIGRAYIKDVRARFSS